MIIRLRLALQDGGRMNEWRIVQIIKLKEFADNGLNYLLYFRYPTKALPS